METKKIVKSLRSLVNYQGIHHFYHTGKYGDNFPVGDVIDEAAERLEELEAEIAKLKQQLSEKQPEWISVEDERKPKHLQNYFVAYVFRNGKEHFFREAMYIADKGNGIVDGAHFNDEGVDGMRVTHWMEIPKVPEPPKPKEPSFKDVFLEKFPFAQLHNDELPKVCVQSLFGIKCLYTDTEYGYKKCLECWNQPYFEEEEGEADA